MTAPATSSRRPRRRGARSREQPQPEREDGDPDRDVDEEDPVPVEHVGEDPAEEDADRAAAGGDEAEHAHRLRALAGLGEQHHHQRETDRGDHRAAEPLHRARDDERALRGREAAGERGDGEERDPDQEQPPVAEQVAEAAAEQEEPAEGQQVGVHDPGERGLVEAEILPDRRQGDVHDRRVEHDHQRAETEDDECVPAFATVHAHGLLLTSLRRTGREALPSGATTSRSACRRARAPGARGSGACPEAKWFSTARA